MGLRWVLITQEDFSLTEILFLYGLIFNESLTVTLF